MDSPPDNEERRPGEEATLSKSDTSRADIPSRVVDQLPLAQMKRRREAALRLPPLESGMRDPQVDLVPRDGAA